MSSHAPAQGGQERYAAMRGTLCRHRGFIERRKTSGCFASAKQVHFPVATHSNTEVTSEHAQDVAYSAVKTSLTWKQKQRSRLQQHRELEGERKG
eukprot:6206071-Pleurochrysis_carterae.AAC.6